MRGKTLMVKTKQTGEDVCLAILALLEIKINMPVNHTSAEGSSSGRTVADRVKSTLG